jgi:S1-C subfamily serine protease
VSGTRRWVAAALVAAALAAVAGCGGGDTTTTVQVGGSDRNVVVHSQNGAFDAVSVFDRAGPGVVTITSIFPAGSTSLLGGGRGGQGSGFVVSDDGEIATNAHVVTDGELGGGTEIHEAKQIYVQFPDRNQVPAEIVGYDPNADVALLHVDPDGLDLHPLELATDEDVQVGQPVAVIGSPLRADLTQSLSVGVVSATDRNSESLTKFQIDGMIQTDASVNPGNSGGPLLDADARVIGINQQIASASGGNEGIAFAVPIKLVSRSLDALRQDGHVEYSYLGVSTQPLFPQLADRLDIPSDTGALVAKVKKGGPAAAAGLQGSDDRIHFDARPVAIGGDVIVAIDGHEVATPSDLSSQIATHDPGDTVTLKIIRDGDTKDLDVTLGSRPDAAG